MVTRARRVIILCSYTESGQTLPMCQLFPERERLAEAAVDGVSGEHPEAVRDREARRAQPLQLIGQWRRMVYRVFLSQLVIVPLGVLELLIQAEVARQHLALHLRGGVPLIGEEQPHAISSGRDQVGQQQRASRLQP